MRVHFSLSCLAFALLVLFSEAHFRANADEPLQFNRDIRPILSENCFPCHGPDKGNRQADLRLDEREAAIASEAIVPRKPDDSSLLERIFSDDADLKMPPPESNKHLSARQKEMLREWIAQGAEYQKHWSYEPPKKMPTPPNVHPVDFFIQERLSKLKLSPAREADRRTLMRRLHSDLIGLPPSPEEVARFVANENSNAYDELVESLLASPHFGERFAIGWLDVVRFADTIGYHSDNPRNIWPYRDWVIRSFNDNKPFDRFTIEQIAGDLLPNATLETRTGSAFNRLLLSTEEGGAQPKDYESRMLTDRVRAIGAAWLGQTTGCAQCHDHKFDPFTMRDFYSLGAFFADVKESAIGRREEGLPVPSLQQQEQLAELDQQLQEARSQRETLREQKLPEEVKQLSDQITLLEKDRKTLATQFPRCLVSESSTTKRTVRILPRGNWMDESGPLVSPALPHYLPQSSIAPKDGSELTRLDLARWLVSRENPLTARTVMNRLWKQLFGIGLSRVMDDLGAQGETPLHPELLDWLACEFMDSGWDLKHMVKVIVTSHAYRQVSSATPELLAIDPDNRAIARQSAFRIDAELVRDYALSVSGLLSSQIGGASVKPYQPDNYWENLNFPKREYVRDKGDQQYRRGLYVWWQRSFLHPSLLAFDAPSREECCADRSRSNIPQQALVLLNDPTYVEAARALATRILQNSKGSEEEQLKWAWQRVLQRDPRRDELEIALKLLQQHRSIYQTDPQAATAILKVGQSSVPPKIDEAELAAWTHVARVLLNLHETITRS